MDREIPRGSVSFDNVMGLIRSFEGTAKSVHNVSHDALELLQSTTIKDISNLVEDAKQSLFIASNKQDVKFKPEDVETFEDVEKLVWEEMRKSMGIIKEELLALGLVLIPLFGQYKYTGVDRLTVEHSMLVPMTRSYTGYQISAFEKSYLSTAVDFRELAMAVCSVLGQETVVFKSITDTDAVDVYLMTEGKEITWIGRRVNPMNGPSVKDLASLLMEDAVAGAPDLDITQLYTQDLRDALLDSGKWWSITSSRDGSLVHVMSRLYSEEDRQALKLLRCRR